MSTTDLKPEAISAINLKRSLLVSAREILAAKQAQWRDLEAEIGCLRDKAYELEREITCLAQLPGDNE